MDKCLHDIDTNTYTYSSEVLIVHEFAYITNALSFSIVMVIVRMYMLRLQGIRQSLQTRLWLSAIIYLYELWIMFHRYNANDRIGPKPYIASIITVTAANTTSTTLEIFYNELIATTITTLPT